MKLIDQNLLELIITALVSGGAFLFLRLWNGMSDLNKRLDEILTKVNSIELNVVKEYTPKSHHDQIAGTIFKKLDKLADDMHRLDHTKEDRFRRPSSD